VPQGALEPTEADKDVARRLVVIFGGSRCCC
jgi:hypothetical protein